MPEKVNIIACDAVYTATWQEVLNRSAIRELPANTKTLVDNVAQIGYENAASKLKYRDSILSYLDEWTRKTLTATATGANNAQYGYAFLQSLETDQRIMTIIMDYSSKWVKVISQETTNSVWHNVYNADIAQLVINNSAIERRESANMKWLIPIPYVLLEIFFLSLSLIFGVSFYYGLNGNGFIIGPWTHLLLLVGTVGLALTVLAGGCEWVYKQHGQPK